LIESLLLAMCFAEGFRSERSCVGRRVDETIRSGCRSITFKGRLLFIYSAERQNTNGSIVNTAIVCTCKKWYTSPLRNRTTRPQTNSLSVKSRTGQHAD